MATKKKTKKHLLLVDGENILHQSFHKFAHLKSRDGKPSGAIYGFFKSFHHYITRFGPDSILVTFDNGHSKERVKLLENYKGHRKNIAIDYTSLQSQKRVILKMLKYLGIPYIFDKSKEILYEGDDYLAWVVINRPKGTKVTIVSSDKDFNQLISKDVRILNPRKDEIVNQQNCQELFGYTPEQTVSYLALVGDTSDDIPGVKGIGPVKAKAILDKYATVPNALEMGCPDGDKIAPVWEKNRFLIDLRFYLEKFPLQFEDIPLKETRGNLERFIKTAKAYSLNSFITDIFLSTFQNNYGKIRN